MVFDLYLNPKDIKVQIFLEPSYQPELFFV